jgi:hypothetical protein
MKNPAKLFFCPALVSLVLLAGCYYPYYGDEAVYGYGYGGYGYGGYGYGANYGWPYYGFYPYSGSYYDSYWFWGPSSYYYRPYGWRNWQQPPYRPGAPYYRPAPRYTPGWRDGQGGPRQPNAPAFRSDSPNVRSPDSRSPRSFTPMPRGGR